MNTLPMPSIAAGGVVHNGAPAAGFGRIDGAVGYPDVRSFRAKFGLLVPATNTSAEHELWSIVGANPELAGVGIHTVNVPTPAPRFGTPEELAEYRRQFLGGLHSAVDQALLAEPDQLVMGMSLEHILHGLDAVRAPVTEAAARSGLPWVSWHDAAAAALRAFEARRIGVLTPFDRAGNENAARMFQDLGFDVVATVGFACAHALHVAHIPDWVKEKAIMELLATAGNRLDAVVQCGTNMSLIQVTERLEPMLGIPVLGINATLFWHALRGAGIAAPVTGAGRLLREH